MHCTHCGAPASGPSAYCPHCRHLLTEPSTVIDVAVAAPPAFFCVGGLLLPDPAETSGDILAFLPR